MLIERGFKKKGRTDSDVAGRRGMQKGAGTLLALG